MDTLELYENIVAYEARKISLIVTGGGLGVVDLAKVMGASKVLNVVYVPYSTEESRQFVVENTTMSLEDLTDFRFVSEAWAKLLCQAGMNKWPRTRVVVCTASTTTSRYRRGLNHAWIADGEDLLDPDEGDMHRMIATQHIELSKLSEEDHEKSFPGYVAWKRSAEDREISNSLLKTIFRS